LENLYNEELHNLYTSPNIIRKINSTRMKWKERACRIHGMNAYMVSLEKPDETSTKTPMYKGG
jgi:hypothetical protein